MKTSFFCLLVLFQFHVYGQYKNTSIIDSFGKKVDTTKTTSAAGNIVYSGTGIVIYENMAVSISRVEADGGCLLTDFSYLYSRCASFTMPANYPECHLIPYSWFEYVNNGCQITSVTTLRNSKGELMVEPYVVSPGETYTYCLSITSPDCIVIKTCFAPFTYPIPSTLDHYLTTDNSLLKKGSEGGSFKVCADGSSVSKFRLKYYSDLANVEVKIQEDETGAESDIYGKFTSSNLISNGKEFVYMHPKYMSRDGSVRLIVVALYNKVSNQTIRLFTILIYRPPLIMIHGLDSNREAFLPMKNAFRSHYPEELLLNVGYEPHNKSSFATNSRVIPTAIEQLTTHLRKLDYAFKKVDLVGHSMGGILSRLYLQTGSNKDNVNKLITINTPHSGSQMADLLLDPNLRLDLKILACYIMSCGQGAINDLRVNSVAIDQNLNGPLRAINTTPCHAIATTWLFSPDAAQGQFWQRTVARYLIELAKDLGQYYTRAFSGNPNDMIVEYRSQLGGLQGNCSTTFSEQMHVGAQEMPAVIERVRFLLGQSPQSSYFCSGFNPINLVYTPINSVSNQNAPLSNTLTLNVANPLNNEKVKIGSSINVKAQGMGLSSMKVYVLVSENLMYKSEVSGSSIDFDIDIDATFRPGDVPIIIIGKDVNGYIVSDYRTIRVTNCTPNITLSGITQNGIYEATNAIQSNSSIGFGMKVTMLAGKAIILNPGFSSETYSTSKIAIENCD